MNRIATAIVALALFVTSAAVGMVGANLLTPSGSPTAPASAPTMTEVETVAEASAVPTIEDTPAPITDEATVETEVVAEVAPPVAPAAPEAPEPTEPAGPPDADLVATFVASFSTAHATGDLAFLLETIHPTIPHTFGSTTCRDYVEATAGSIEQMTVVAVSDRHQFTLPSPDGAVVFDDAIPVEATWVISHSGEAQTITFHLAPITGTDQLGWLTQCGVQVQTA